MLYDPKWEVEIKADPFSLGNLISWLEKQPANKSYNWESGDTCLLGQWLKTIDPEVQCSFHNVENNLYLYEVNGEKVDLSKFEKIARDDYNIDTFGHALDRARASLSRSPQENASE